MEENNPHIGTAASAKPLRIDLEAVLRQKLGQRMRYVPRCVVAWLRRTICEQELNEILRRYGDCEGADFARGSLEYFGVEVSEEGLDAALAAAGPDARLFFVSNHPLGGLDGLALIDLLDRRLGSIRWIVNDLLMAVKPLRPVFLPVNKHGRQSRDEVSAIDAALAGDGPIGTFPAGLCSRNTHGRVIEDLEWKPSFVKNAVDYRRTVIPVHFDGANSRFFYRLARWRERLGLKFNIEMIYLPKEMVKQRGARLHVTFGQPIPYDTFDASRSRRHWAAWVREQVYNLNHHHD